MEFNKLDIYDTDLFVSGDITLIYFRKNNINTVEELLQVEDVSLLVGEKTRDDTKAALKAIIDLSRYKYLGESMDVTNSLDSKFEVLRDENLGIRERRAFAAIYFRHLGLRPGDSMYVFHCFKKMKENTTLIDGFKQIYQNISDNDKLSCLRTMLGLYISDYSSRKSKKEAKVNCLT